MLKSFKEINSYLMDELLQNEHQFIEKIINIIYKPEKMTTILDELEKIGPVEDQKTGLVTNLKNHGFKYLGLYFTATWCSYCVKIVDKLPKIIEKVNHRGPDLKLLTIRLDDERSNFAYNYLKFKSITYEECQYLANQLSVRGIPSILIYNLAGKLISSDGLRDIMRQPEKAVEMWDKMSQMK